MKFTDQDIAQFAKAVRKLSILRHATPSPTGKVLIPGQEAVKELGISGMRDPGKDDPIFMTMTAKPRRPRSPIEIITQKI